jgi:phasin family protein
MGVPVRSESSNTQFLDAYKAEARVNLGFINALLSGAERIRALRLEAARETQAQINRVAREIGDAQDFQDLMTLQPRLLADCCLGPVSYWTRLAKAVQQSQVDLATCVRDRWTRGVSQTLPTNFNIPMPTPMPSLAAIMENISKAATDANTAIFKAIGATDAPAKGKVQQAV